MSQLRRFDQEILELCHALGGRMPDRQPASSPPERGKKKKLAKSRSAADDDDDDFGLASFSASDFATGGKLVGGSRRAAGNEPSMPSMVDPDYYGGSRCAAGNELS